MKESLDHQIAEWLQNGVITESVSEYSSPLAVLWIPTQEFGGPNESQYPVSNAPCLARSNRSLASGSITSQSESGSAGNSTINEDGDRTIYTSQHALGSTQVLGSSHAQPPNPDHASTPTQLQGRTPGSDRSTSSSLKCPPLLEDAFLTIQKIIIKSYTEN